MVVIVKDSVLYTVRQIGIGEYSGLQRTVEDCGKLLGRWGMVEMVVLEVMAGTASMKYST